MNYSHRTAIPQFGRDGYRGKAPKENDMHKGNKKAGFGFVRNPGRLDPLQQKSTDKNKDLAPHESGADSKPWSTIVEQQTKAWQRRDFQD